jgi:hypothetical protein
MNKLKGNRENGSQVNFNFILTEECNWNCEYCSFPKLKNPKKPDMDIIKMHLEYIKDFLIEGYMDVQGGEIGLVDIGLLEYFFTTMGRKMFISTNGVFLNKKMHLNEKIRPYIKMIQWHIFPSPDGFVVIDDIKDPDIFISKGIVYHDADEMIEFINMNKHILFNYIDFEYDIGKEVSYDREKYRDLYNKINHLENLTEDAKMRIRKRAQEPNDLRETCRDKNDSILIDLVNEKICLCQRNMHINVDLGLLTLFKRCWTDSKEFFDIKDETCFSCGRLYEGKTRGLSRI